MNKIKTRKVDVKIIKPNGEIVFQKDQFEVPEFWSDRAATICASRYATDDENSAIDIINRVIIQIAQWGMDQKYFNDDPFDNIGHEQDTDYYKFSEKLKDILINQRAAFNSPVWFNCGSNSGNNQMSACFILPIEDTMESILEHYKTEGLIFRGGSGSGVNVSKLRAKGEKLSNKGESSGPISFMRGWDSNAGTIKSAGKQRRAAKLVCMDADHPDIMEFIECKFHEENKAKILMNNGISSEEAYSTVDFQNTNHSIRVSDEFMTAVENNEDWTLEARGKDKSFNKTVKAKDILHKTAEIAWETGDPGIQFHDRMNIDNPVPLMGEIESTNPCFVGDTRIATPNGLITIKELCEAAMSTGKMTNVYTKDNIESTPIAYMATGINKILKVTLSDGRHVRCTPNHLWYIDNQKIETKDLKKGMQITLFTGTEIKNTRKLNVESDINNYKHSNIKEVGNNNFPTEATHEFAELLGHLTGDGYLSEGDSWSVGWIFGTQPDESIILYNRYKKLLDSYFPINTTVNNNGCKVVRYNRIPIMKYFLDLGFTRCKAHNKRVPEFIFKSDNEIIASYLKGYFGADGTVYGKEKEGSCSINCASTSYKLLTDIQLLLDVLNIRSRIRILRKSGTVTFKNQKTYNTKICYRLMIDTRDIENFQSKVGFSVNYKNEKLNILLKNRKSIKVRNPNVSILSIEEDGYEQTYNLTEPINNLIYANGILIAQCSEFSAINSSSCNLSSLNLVKYYKENMSESWKDKFNWKQFKEDIEVMITAMDILIDAADYPTEKIAEITKTTRPLGLGFSNLGALLMIMGYPYDSQDARNIASLITETMTYNAYMQSIKLGMRLGSFKEFEQNRYSCSEIAGRLTPHMPIDLKYKLLDNTINLRNSQLTLLAPCGCVTSDTLIPTNKGLKRIIDLGNKNGNQWQNINYKVSTDDGPQNASKFYINGIANTITITTKSGYSFTGTSNHKIKVFDINKGLIWKCLSDISNNEIIPLSLNQIIEDVDIPLSKISFTSKDIHFNCKEIILPEYMTDDLAYLIGIFMGDGSWHNKGLRISCDSNDKILINKLINKIKIVFNIEPTIITNKNCKIIYINSTILRDWWTECGFIKTPEINSVTYTSHVPKIIYNKSSYISAFLAGLFDTDGSNDEGIPKICNKNYSFVKELQNLFLYIGIPTNIKINNVGGKSNKPVYRLRLSSGFFVTKFKEKLPCLNERKLNVLIKDQLVSRSSIYINKTTYNKYFKIKSQDRINTIARYNKFGKIPRCLAIKIATNQKATEIEKALEFWYESVSDITKNIASCTYDLSVPYNTTYIANGFISHNTISFLMDCDTTGIEPLFARKAYKQLSDGGQLKIEPDCVKQAQKQPMPKTLNNVDVLKTANEISWQDHILMMAACQKFLNGSISKTINMPTNTTVQDVEDAYKLAWKEGLKAVAIYRDGSKAMQPLKETKPIEVKEIIKPQEEPKWMAFRKRLPKTRDSITHAFNICGFEGYITVGLYEDGEPGEVFINTQKQGSMVSGLMDSFAVLLSFALQYGVPLEKLVDKFKDTRFEPAGITDNEDIRITTSVMDYIFRWLSNEFFHDIEEETKVEEISNLDLDAKIENIKSIDASGPPCYECGGITVRSGTCFYCQMCGSTSGCS